MPPLPRCFAPFPVLAALLAACGAPVLREPELADAPIAASERRAVIHVVLGLPPCPACDETFDLALYRERGVELVVWERQAESGLPEGSCRQLHATVRYLPGRITEPALVAKMKTLSRSLEVRP